MIGRSVSSELCARGKEVVATWFSNRPSERERLVLSSVKWQRFPSNKREWQSLLEETETIFHVANKLWNFSEISAKPNGPLEEEPEKNNIILQMALEFGVKKLVWISSSIGYGSGTEKYENHFFSGDPLGPYESLIRCLREFEASLSRGYPSLDIRVFRPTTIIGPPAKPPSESSHIFTRLIAELMTKGGTSIYDPDPQRNYIFVDNLAKLLCDEAFIPPRPGVSEAYNLRGQTDWTHFSIASEAARQLGLSPGVVRMVPGDRFASVVDLPADKINSRLKLHSTPLEEIVEAIIKGLRAVMH